MTRIVTLHYVIFEADGQFAAECKELGTASCGDTVEEALSNIQEAVAVHLEALTSLGQLERVFREKGIIPQATPAQREPAHASINHTVPVAV